MTEDDPQLRCVGHTVTPQSIGILDQLYTNCGITERLDPDQILATRQKSQQSHCVLFLYTEEQHCFLHKSAIFHNKATKNGGIAAKQRYLMKFYMEWFEKFPEDTCLTRSDLNLESNSLTSDLYHMVQLAENAETKHEQAPPAESSYHTQIHMAEEAKLNEDAHHRVGRAAMTDPIKTVAFCAMLEALVYTEHDDNQLEDSDKAPIDLTKL
ncbi:hypothetical protein IW262DRAFT_1289835 [Armillaria fumosa]|nr:hypothetical protein IW262DRAFT_1289835 [Armillaria fumosa]